MKRIHVETFQKTRYILANKKQESMQILPFWLMSIFKALEAFYFLTNMTWEVFGMSGKIKLFQWWSQVVEFDTKHLNVVGISFAQVCLSLPHSNLPNKVLIFNYQSKRPPNMLMLKISLSVYYLIALEEDTCKKHFNICLFLKRIHVETFQKTRYILANKKQKSMQILHF